ncbi:hypothetical protein MRB53_032738 [Persea americana]|uniref:Uncharacterized protein n=1 Tax=Persea americana TaxID=3435 RepID=A0ACC2KTA4_PERAE|nr:hypothetical protein MRB53_032738 [Persea americana]
MSEIGARQLVQALQNPSRHQLFLEDEHYDVDKEYRPARHSEEELNLSDEEELEDEFAHTAPGKRRQYSAEPQVSVPDPSPSRRVRGRVVGHESEKRMRILGSRIYVPLGAQSGAFEGANASTFAIELGSQIRQLAPLHKETWGAIDDGCKEAIFTVAVQKYDFVDWKTDAHVAVAVGRLVMHIYREFRAELHRAYKKLLEKGQDPKRCPYDTQRAAQWIWLIENKWETPEWKCSATKGEGKSKKACDAMLNTLQKVRNLKKPI